MLVSMTGFSRRSEAHPWGTLSAEISSINSRYLEVHVRAGRDLASFEPFIHSFLRSRLHRGKVTIRLDLHWSSEVSKSRLNCELLTQYFETLKGLEKELQTAPVALADVLPLPGVSDSPALADLVESDLQSALKELLESVIADLKKMRATEGLALKEDIETHLTAWSTLLGDIDAKWKTLSAQAFEDYRQKVTTSIERLGYSVEPARLAQELVMQADKWDISEELARSRSHIAQFETVVEAKEPSGRKLDFLLQEMNREINTIGSKSASTDLRWLVVEGKTLLERIREQVQNVE